MYIARHKHQDIKARQSCMTRKAEPYMGITYARPYLTQALHMQGWSLHIRGWSLHMPYICKINPYILQTPSHIVLSTQKSIGAKTSSWILQIISTMSSTSTRTPQIAPALFPLLSAPTCAIQPSWNIVSFIICCIVCPLIFVNLHCCHYSVLICSIVCPLVIFWYYFFFNCFYLALRI